MDKMMEIMNSIGLDQPIYLLAAGALVIVLLIALIVVSRRQMAEINDWSEQCRNLRSEIDSLDRDARLKKSQIADGEKELEKAREELTQAKEDFDGQLHAKDEETATMLRAKEEESDTRLKTQEADAAAQLKAQEEKYEAMLQAQEAAAAAQMSEKDAEVARMQEQVDQWNMNRDAIVSDARKQADAIISDANQSAMEIMEEAARRLAESEEEVRKNRMIAATSLTDARKRISEMLLSAAGELCKGIPASSPIGYAPVYKIEETEAAQSIPAEEVKETEEFEEE